MKIEIWSDVMCPFCYIGKRRLEEAMAQIGNASDIELVWKSFQLDPDLEANGRQTPIEYLAGRKGMSHEQSVQMHDNVVKMATGAGLNYRFDKAVIANSFDAHRLLQLAKTKGFGDALEEELFRSYFTEGKDIGDHATLVEIGKTVGLKEEEIVPVLNSNAFTEEVQRDVFEAQQIGVRGVPFFVFDRKYAISGAQQTEAFVETLQTSLSEWRAANPDGDLKVMKGDSCPTDGECD